MVLNCSHHYCRKCGMHGSYTVEFSHYPDCPLLPEELQAEKAWKEYRARLRSRSNQVMEDE